MGDNQELCMAIMLGLQQAIASGDTAYNKGKIDAYKQVLSALHISDDFIEKIINDMTPEERKSDNRELKVNCTMYMRMRNFEFEKDALKRFLKIIEDAKLDILDAGIETEIQWR